MTDKQLVNIINRVNETGIGSIKGVIITINKLINNPYTTTKDFVNVVKHDPPLVAAILKVANSSFFLNKRESVSDIAEAIIRIGFDEFYQILIHQKIGKLFQSSTEKYGYSRTRLWIHSVAVALLVKNIFRKEFREPGNTPYIIGLLHEIGIIIQDQILQNRFENILETANNNNVDFISAEQATQSINHCEIGMALARNWNFPQEMISAIGYHHITEISQNKSTKMELALYLADTICNERVIGFCDSSTKDETLFQKCLVELNIEIEALELIADDVEHELLNKSEKELI